MIAKLLSAVVAGVVAFLVSALAHQFARGFEDGVLVSGGGIAVTVVGSGWGWLVGAAIFGIAAATATLARRADRMWWLALAATTLVLAVAGSVLRAVLPGDALGGPLLWLADGAAEPLTWAVAALALVVAAGGRVAGKARVSRPRPR